MSFLPTQTVASQAYNRLFTTVTARLAGAGKQALELEISNAMQEFCRETHVWRELVQRNLVAGQSFYDLGASKGNSVVTYIISVVADDRWQAPLGGEAFTNNSNNVFDTYRVTDDLSQIILYPTPKRSVAKGLQAWVGLVPRNGGLDVPDTIIDHHFESLLDGCLERLFGHKNKPYSDTNMAAYHHRRFRASITRVRRAIRAGNASASPPWRFHTQAPGRPLRGGRSYGW